MPTAVHTTLKPGSIFLHDYRTTASRSPPLDRPLRIVQWNIERGYELAKIIQILKEVNADVLALQEIDIGCERSQKADVGVEIAAALQLNYAFLCEFEELHSPLRKREAQGGGVHGNGILSRYDLCDIRAINHRCQPVDWTEENRFSKREPRRGRRLSLAARILCPEGPLLVYSCHLEVFCGMLDRVQQTADIMRDSKEQIGQVPHQAFLGDLNTMGHGVARLSLDFCRDHMRLCSLGQSEGGWFERNVLAVHDPRFQPGHDDSPALQDSDAAPINSNMMFWGLPANVCSDVLNPGFVDPWVADNPDHATLDNPAWRFFGRSLMKGKLDWMLLRRLRVMHKDLTNHDYSASDHKLLWVDVEWS